MIAFVEGGAWTLQSFVLAWLFAMPLGSQAVGQAPKKDTAAAEDLKKVQGLWHALFLRRDDRADPAVHTNLRVLVKGDTITFAPDSILKMSGKLQLLPDESPPEMRILVKDGLFQGQTLFASYELKAESMNFKFRIARFTGGKATRERPKEIMPGRGADFETLELVREERLDPEMMESKPSKPTGFFAPRPDTIAPALRYFGVLYWQRMSSIEEVAAVPFLHNDTVLKDEAALNEAHKAILTQFGDLKKGPPSIRDYQTYGSARETMAPELRSRLDDLITKNDVVLVVCEPEGSKETAENYVIVQLINRGSKPRVVGVVKKPTVDQK